MVCKIGWYISLSCKRKQEAGLCVQISTNISRGLWLTCCILCVLPMWQVKCKNKLWFFRELKAGCQCFWLRTKWREWSSFSRLHKRYWINGLNFRCWEHSAAPFPLLCVCVYGGLLLGYESHTVMLLEAIKAWKYLCAHYSKIASWPMSFARDK